MNLWTSMARTCVSFICIVSSKKATSLKIRLLEVSTYFGEQFSSISHKLRILITERLIERVNILFSLHYLKMMFKADIVLFCQPHIFDQYQRSKHFSIQIISDYFVSDFVFLTCVFHYISVKFVFYLLTCKISSIKRFVFRTPK